ncbi:hypothetical protein Lser_V15G30584 [Lactuca serriola]
MEYQTSQQKATIITPSVPHHPACSSSFIPIPLSLQDRSFTGIHLPSDRFQSPIYPHPFHASPDDFPKTSQLSSPLQSSLL